MSAFSEQRCGHRCDAHACKRELVQYDGQILGGAAWYVDDKILYSVYSDTAGWRHLFGRTFCPDHSGKIEERAERIKRLLMGR